MKYLDVKSAYDEVFALMEKHRELWNFEIAHLKIKADNQLLGLELKEVYGYQINENNITNANWTQLKEYLVIGKFGENNNRTIAWSDDGRQPEDDEYLVRVCFPSGAFIFGRDCPTTLFNEMFEEFKSYEPKYTDTHNHTLYFNIDNGSKVFNDYDSIMKKYHKRNREELKQRQIDTLKSQLFKLENE